MGEKLNEKELEAVTGGGAEPPSYPPCKFRCLKCGFPSISTGRSSYPQKGACEIAVGAVYAWLAENGAHPIKVVFSSVDPKIHDLLYQSLRRVQEEGTL